MKNDSKFGFISLLVLVLLIGYSCQKEDYSLQTEALINYEKVENVLDFRGITQKLAYRLLNADEKHLIWQIRLKNYLEENDLNVRQVKLINELHDALVPELFQIQNLKLREELKKEFDEFKKAWLVEAEKEFTSNQRKEIGYQLSSNPKKDISLKQMASMRSSGESDCECYHDSNDDCPSGYICLYSAPCNITLTGCGWFWLESCDGLCYPGS